MDFLAVVRTVSDRWDHEVLGKPMAPILSEPDKTFAQVARMFELRHIVCHEAASELTVDLESIEEGFVHTSLFLKASEEVASATLFPSSPLTQADMNFKAGNDLEEMLVKVDTYRVRVRGRLERDDKERVAGFDEANASWAHAMKAWATFEADAYRLGSIRPVIYAGAARRVLEYHLEVLKLTEKQLELEP
jgi:hypothetical protein